MFLISSKPRSTCLIHRRQGTLSHFRVPLGTTGYHRSQEIQICPTCSQLALGTDLCSFPPFRAGLSQVGDILYKSQGSQRLGRKVSFEHFHGQGFPARLARTRGKGDFGLLPGCGPPVIALQRSAVPVPQVCGRLVGRLKERKEYFIRG